MSLKVLKFGGSSLSDAKQFQKVAAIVRAEEERRYVVPSAPGKRYDNDTKVTDLLYASHAAAANGEGFDEAFARATGTKAQLINSVIAVLTAVTVVIGMRMMGALLISSLIIFPALTAMRICRSFKGVVICSAVVSVVCVVIGMAASYAFELPSGAAIVIVNIIAFAAFSFAALLKKRT